MPREAQLQLRAHHIKGAAPNLRRWTCRVKGLAIVSLITATSLCMTQTKAADTIAFDIPSQSLNGALGRYGDATGREALYDASLTAGKLSGDVVGVFSPDEALRQLLSTTGLVPEFIDEKKFVLLAAPEVRRQASRKARSPQHWRYYGLIQLTILDVLCRSRHARPGQYRIVALFWIAPDGTVEKVRRIGSTGGAEIDQQFDAVLRRARVGEPPPADFVSPVLMLIVPEDSGMTICNSVNATPGPLGIGR